jgi:hypothetical protein
LRLLITRRLPEANMAAARERFEAVFREEDRGLAPDEAARALRDFDAILPTLGDRFTARPSRAGRIAAGSSPTSAWG